MLLKGKPSNRSRGGGGMGPNGLCRKFNEQHQQLFEMQMSVAKSSLFVLLLIISISFQFHCKLFCIYSILTLQYFATPWEFSELQFFLIFCICLLSLLFNRATIAQPLQWFTRQRLCCHKSFPEKRRKIKLNLCFPSLCFFEMCRISSGL